MTDELTMDYFELREDLQNITSANIQLESYLTDLSTLVHLSSSIEEFGITPTTIQMFSERAADMCPNIGKVPAERVLSELSISTEGIIDAIGQFIKDLLAKLTTFLRKFFSSTKGVAKSISNHGPDFRKKEGTEEARNVQVYGYSKHDFDTLVRTFDSHVETAKDFLAEWGVEAKANEAVMDKAALFFNGLGFMVDSEGRLTERKSMPKRTKIAIRLHGFEKMDIEKNIDTTVTMLDRSSNLDVVRKRLSLTYTSGFLGKNRSLEASDKRDFMRLVSNTSKALKYMADIALSLGMQQIDMMKAYRDK